MENILPVPKKTPAKLNDFRPVAVMSHVMKVLEADLSPLEAAGEIITRPSTVFLLMWGRMMLSFICCTWMMVVIM